MGKPDIKQIILLEDLKDNPEMFGLYTVEGAVEFLRDKRMKVDGIGRADC
jgi:hypothetical protein